jgi:CO dehydrogenase maturation factor
MCRAHATVRGLIGELIGSDWAGSDVVLDLEAGLEVLSRSTPRHVDAVLVVVEPYYRSLETGRRVYELAQELEVPRVHAVANKVRDERDGEAIREFCRNHDMQVLADIPFDDSLVDAERSGRPPIDYDPASPAVAAIRRLGGSLIDG